MGAVLEKGGCLPGAFVADNDLIALGAVRAMKRQGLRVPEDYSVMGFDDVPLCILSDPVLTSMAVPRKALGELAVRRLVERMRGEAGPPVKTVVPTALQMRQSVKRK